MTNQSNELELKKVEDALEDGLLAYAAELGKRYVAMYPADPQGYWFLGFILHQLDRYADAKVALNHRARFSCKALELAFVM